MEVGQKACALCTGTEQRRHHVLPPLRAPASAREAVLGFVALQRLAALVVAQARRPGPQFEAHVRRPEVKAVTGCSAHSTAVGRLQRQPCTMGRPTLDTPPSKRHQRRQRSPSCGAVWRTQRMQAGRASCCNHACIGGSFFRGASSLAISEHTHTHTHTHARTHTRTHASRRPNTDMAQFCAEAIPISGRWLPPLVRNHRSCCRCVHQTCVVHAARLFGHNLVAILTTSRSPHATWVSCSFPEHVKQGVSNRTETSKVLLVFLN